MHARRGSEAGINGSWRRWARPLCGALILGVVIAFCGGGAFVDALRATDALALTVGSAVAAVTTACAAWRWRLVARALQVELPMGAAVAACYRSQFLNVTLPGGVLGDVDRGVRHGRQVHDVGRGLRAVAWERASGQVVLTGVTVAALLVGSPLGSSALFGATAVLAATAVVVLGVSRMARKSRSGVPARMSRMLVTEARGLVAPSALVGIVVMSLVVLAGHVATFALAARTVGVRLPLVDLVPLALVVLLVAAVPLNVAGWGPREGAAAWAFAAAGTGATQGLAVAVAYGAIVFVATLPGAVLLLVHRSRWPLSASRFPWARRAPRRSRRADRPAGDAVEVTAHG